MANSLVQFWTIVQIWTFLKPSRIDTLGDREIDRARGKAKDLADVRRTLPAPRPLQTLKLANGQKGEVDPEKQGEFLHKTYVRNEIVCSNFRTALEVAA